MIRAFIPIRYSDCVDSTKNMLYSLQGKPLWDFTIEKAFKSDIIDEIYVGYDDDNCLSYLSKYISEKIILIKRPDYLSLNGVTTLEVLAFIASLHDYSSTDYWVLLEISHPLRPEGIIDEVILRMKDLQVDTLLTVSPLRYNIWIDSVDTGIEKIIGASEQSNVIIYQELLGIGSIFKQENLVSDDFFGDEIDIIPVEKFWSKIDLKNEDDIWLANAYLEKIKTNLVN